MRVTTRTVMKRVGRGVPVAVGVKGAAMAVRVMAKVAKAAEVLRPEAAGRPVGVRTPADRFGRRKACLKSNSAD